MTSNIVVNSTNDVNSTLCIELDQTVPAGGAAASFLQSRCMAPKQMLGPEASSHHVYTIIWWRGSKQLSAHLLSFGRYQGLPGWADAQQ